MLGHTDLNDTGMTEISAALPHLTNLSWFTFDVKYNSIKSKGAEVFASSLSKLINLKNLTLDFSGYSM